MELLIWIMLGIIGYLAVGSVYYGIGHALNDMLAPIDDSLLYRIWNTWAIEDLDDDDIFCLNSFPIRIIGWPIFIVLLSFFILVLIIAHTFVPLGEWMVNSIVRKISKQQCQQ